MSSQKNIYNSLREDVKEKYPNGKCETYLCDAPRYGSFTVCKPCYEEIKLGLRVPSKKMLLHHDILNMYDKKPG